ncbi:MAG: PDZ domain-containing protein [Rhodothermales bacterium]
MPHSTIRCLILCLLTAATGLPAAAQTEDTRLLRNPAISETDVAFVYANDIWIAPRAGGDARRLTTFEGAETEPHFSPDGQWIAFSGQYDGNTDVYLVATAGGEPTRITWHPGADLVRGWTPDGRQIVFASARTSPVGVTRFFTVSREGGLPEPMPMPRAFQGHFAPDGSHVAYQMVQPWEDEFRNYRGGQNNPIRVLNLQTLDEEKLPWSADERPNDNSPVWIGDTIFFLSDRDYAMNVWSYDTKTRSIEQRTHFREFDSKSLEAGGGLLVFENGGWLYTLSPAGGEPQRLVVNVRGDFPWARPHWEDVGDYITHSAISPTGKRAVFEARGDIFTVPAEKGDVRNLTASPGTADRAPAWSPDGSRISWFSDASGEYQLVIADQFGAVQKTLALPGATFFYTPHWSPDGKHLTFTDADRVIWVVTVDTGKIQKVDNEGFATPARNIEPVWSPDSRWIAYSRYLPNQFNGIFVYDVEKGGKPVMITDGMSNSLEPAWDKNGKYLYFLASTNYGVGVAWLDMMSYPFTADYAVYLVVLSADEAAPFAPQSDDEATDTDSNGSESDTTKKPVDVRIDFDGLPYRIVALDVPARPYSDVQAGDGVVFFAERIPNQDGLTLHRYAVSERKDTPFMTGVAGYDVSHDGTKLLYAMPGGGYGIVDATGTPAAGDGTIATSAMRAYVDPAAEWEQIFNEAIRFQRDYFYVENVHGLDLAWAKRTYGAWLPSIRHRSDLSYVLDILGGETSIGHSFVGGGDFPNVETVPVGLLGADFRMEQNRYRIARIYTGERWNPTIKAPLSGPRLEVSEGDYLLAVNGRELRAGMNPYSLFEGTAGKQTVLTLSATPGGEPSRQVTVVPVASEQALRNQAWIEGNRQMVDRLSDGRLAYVWLPNTGQDGYTNFNRYYFAQQDKQGAVIDERYNGGGSIADYMVDLMARPLYGYFNNPIGDKTPWKAPNAGIWGPKVMIVNERAGSGGDMLPYMFRHRGVGPLVGTRTWGGLVGIWDVPDFIDGGGMTAPRGGFFNLDREWDVENIGIPPDYEVEQTTRAASEGRDLQIEKAVEVALELLKTQGVTHPAQPADPVRVRRPDGR